MVLNVHFQVPALKYTPRKLCQDPAGEHDIPEPEHFIYKDPF